MRDSRIKYQIVMPALRKEEDPEVIWLSLPLDLKTYAWLASLAENCHAFPEAVGASILRDVCEDDELENDRRVAPVESAMLQ